MRICVFGAGRMGERHIRNVAANPRAELAYIVDPDRNRCADLAARFGAVACANPRQALADPTLDAVIISSATNTHVDLIIASAKAGKNILCEKPIDLDLRRVDFCAREIASLNPRIMIGSSAASIRPTGRCTRPSAMARSASWRCSRSSAAIPGRRRRTTSRFRAGSSMTR